MFASVAFFCAVDMHVAVANKKKQLHRDDGLKLLICIHKFCICGMVQYLYTVTLIDLVCRVVH